MSAPSSFEANRAPCAGVAEPDPFAVPPAAPVPRRAAPGLVRRPHGPRPAVAAPDARARARHRLRVRLRRRGPRRRGPPGRVVVGVERDPEHLARRAGALPLVAAARRRRDTRCPLAGPRAPTRSSCSTSSSTSPTRRRRIAEAQRVLRPGGVLVVSVPHRGAAAPARRAERVRRAAASAPVPGRRWRRRPSRPAARTGTSAAEELEACCARGSWSTASRAPGSACAELVHAHAAADPRPPVRPERASAPRCWLLPHRLPARRPRAAGPLRLPPDRPGAAASGGGA